MTGSHRSNRDRGFDIRLHARPRVSGRSTARTALREIIASTSAALDASLSRVMTSDDPEGAHQARVALRQVRVVLAGFAPLIDKSVLSALKAEARHLFRLIGRLRDADVVAAALTAPSDRDTHAAELARLRTAVRTELAASNALDFGHRLRRLFAGKSWRRRSSRGKALRKAPVKRIAFHALDRAWADCTGYGGSVAALPLAKRHALRKALKTMRYLTEFFEDLWPDKRRATFLDRLKTLQDALGRINDIALLETAVSTDATKRKAYQTEADEALAIAEKAWRKLRKAGTYWD